MRTLVFLFRKSIQLLTHTPSLRSTVSLSGSTAWKDNQPLLWTIVSFREAFFYQRYIKCWLSPHCCVYVCVFVICQSGDQCSGGFTYQLLNSVHRELFRLLCQTIKNLSLNVSNVLTWEWNLLYNQSSIISTKRKLGAYVTLGSVSIYSRGPNCFFYAQTLV